MTEQSQDQNFQQWYRFIENHGHTWQGILSRYDGSGQVTEVLNSTRRFTTNSDASQLEHYLCFINRNDPNQVLEKQWTIEKCAPYIIHPINPESSAMFSSLLSGVMSRPRRINDVNYAEIYLQEDNRRISLVISYHPNESTESDHQCVLAKLSLFREVKQATSPSPWSEEESVIIEREYPQLKVINSSILWAANLTENVVPNDSVSWFEEDRLIFNFPDGITLNVPKTLEPKSESDLILSWQYNDHQVKRAIARFGDDIYGPDLITQECIIV